MIRLKVEIKKGLKNRHKSYLESSKYRCASNSCKKQRIEEYNERDRVKGERDNDRKKMVNSELSSG